jgi:hypothetical protein
MKLGNVLRNMVIQKRKSNEDVEKQAQKIFDDLTDKFTSVAADGMTFYHVSKSEFEVPPHLRFNDIINKLKEICKREEISFSKVSDLEYKYKEPCYEFSWDLE